MVKGGKVQSGNRMPVLAGVLLVLTVALLRQRRRPRDVLDDDAVTTLVVAGLQSGAAESLGLWRRPVLPTSDGAIDLSTARALIRRGLLVVGTQRCADSLALVGPDEWSSQRRWLHHDVRTIDPNHPRVKALLRFVPSVARLDTLTMVGAPLPASLQSLQRRIDRDLVGVAVRVDVGDRIREVVLCTADGKRHQLMIGAALLAAVDDEALWLKLLDEATTLGALRWPRR